MTPTEFRTAREGLGLSINQLAEVLGVEPRTIRKWEATSGDNARPPNPIASRVMQWFQDGFRPPEWPTRAGET